MSAAASRSTDTPDDNISALAQALAAQTIAPTWLASIHTQAQADLASVTFPGRKSERWKYSRTTALAQSGVLAHSAPASNAQISAAIAPQIGGYRLVFVNGRYDATQSRLPANGALTIASLATLPASEHAAAKALLAHTDNMTLPFSLLNRAALSDGAWVHVKKGTVIDQPLHVIFHADGTAPASVQACLLLQLEENAALTLVEQYTNTGDSLYTNAATVIDLARDSRLQWIRAQMENGFFTGSAQLCLRQGSRCEGWLFSTGSRLKRNDIRVTLDGPGSELQLHGAFLAGSRQHVDNQVCLEHASPQATSTQVFKGLAGGDGRAVFNGRIHIHPGAKKTSAELVNNNLLLSADAEIDSKPELEIYNDDVKCAHGATVGRLNAQALFYLRSRGIEKLDAETMLALAFVNEQIDSLPLPALTDWLRGECATWFARYGRSAS